MDNNTENSTISYNPLSDQNNQSVLTAEVEEIGYEQDQNGDWWKVYTIKK
jgi:hypothetical protein